MWPSPAEAVSALEEAVRVIRLIWDLDGKGQKASSNGKFYRLDEAAPGPRPYHRIGIWLGGFGPRMLRLTGRLADGWTVSLPYVLPDLIPEKIRAIEEAAKASGRDHGSIHRNYNFGGVIVENEGAPNKNRADNDVIAGSVEEWVQTLDSFHRLGIDSFNFWPAGHNKKRQIHLHAKRVVPAFLKSVASKKVIHSFPVMGAYIHV